jgi:hypothetical protein
MVHYDYEYGNSTRIDELRLKNSYSKSNFATNGMLYFKILNIFTFGASFMYFWRKFSTYSTPIRLGGTIAMVLPITKVISEWAHINFVNEEALNLYSTKFWADWHSVNHTKPILKEAHQRIHKQMTDLGVKDV